RNPYDVSGFYSPAWLAWASAPLALFPPQMGGVLLFAANLFAYAYVAGKVKPNFFLFALTGIPIAWNSLLANINGLSLAGIFLPAPIGLVLLSLKPQTGLTLAVWKLYMDWTEGKKREVAYAALVILVLVAFAFIAYPDWMDKMLTATGNDYNASLWPYAFPVGVLLFYQAIRKRELRYALMACCLVTPYLTWHTWAYFAIGLFSLNMKFGRNKNDQAADG
ncbi:MAG: hypothetical protein AB1750_20655, partial [Chloroflexota bacterium]